MKLGGVPKLTAVAVLLAALAPDPSSATSDEDRLFYPVVETQGTVAVDTSAYHNDGNLRGGATRRNGKYKFHPVSRDGLYDRIRTPYAPSLNPGTSAFSYGLRLKISAEAEWSHSEMAVIRHGDTDTPGGDYKMELVKTARGTVSAFCDMHDGDGDGMGYVRGSGRLETIADGAWHNIACARVDQDTVSLTIDGHVTERPISGDLNAIIGADPLLIGCQYRRNGIGFREQFVGLMDNIGINTL